MEIKRPEPGEEPEQITLDVKDENSGTTISIDTVISPRKMTYEETMSCFDRAYDELLDILQKDNATGLVTVLIFDVFCPQPFIPRQVGGKTGFKASFANKNRGPHDADPGSIP